MAKEKDGANLRKRRTVIVDNTGYGCSVVIGRTWSVEAKRGGFTIWEDVDAISADEAWGIYARMHPDAEIVGVSLGASKVAWFKEGVSMADMIDHISGIQRS